MCGLGGGSQARSITTVCWPQAKDSRSFPAGVRRFKSRPPHQSLFHQNGENLGLFLTNNHIIVFFNSRNFAEEVGFRLKV